MEEIIELKKNNDDFRRNEIRLKEMYLKEVQTNEEMQN
jgi:hypothetical protein